MSKLTKQLKYILGLGLIIVLAACGGTTDNTLPEDDEDSPGGTPLGISISASPENVETGGVVTMTATIAGDGSESGTVSWSAAGGTLSATSGPEVSWTAPATAGTYTVQAELTAGGGTASDSIKIQVTAAEADPGDELPGEEEPADEEPGEEKPGEGAPDEDEPEESEPLSVSINTTISEAHYAETVEFSAVVAGDGADEAVVAWEASAGTFSAASGLATTWTAPVHTGSITVSASIDGADAADIVTIEVGLCSSGSVTAPADPCVLDNVHQLQAMNEHLAGHFELGDNIDASETKDWNHGSGFTPIGNDSIDFTGSLDGRGHAIRDLHINMPEADYVGLFSSIGASGAISDLVLTDADVTGRQRVGTLAGSNAGSIERSSADEDAAGNGRVTGTGRVGGLVGGNLGTIAHSHSWVIVTANGPASGGLAGSNGSSSNSSAAIRHSSASSPLVSNLNESGSADNGGLVGVNYGIISNSHSASTVVSARPQSGGLVGNHHKDGLIERSYATSAATVTGSHRVGGLVGQNWGRIEQSYSMAAQAEATENRAGGLVGFNRDSGSIFETYSLTKPVAESVYGGLIGENETGGAVERSLWDMESSGRMSSAGGPGVSGIASTSQMWEETTFTSRGWDFTAVWQIDEGNDTPDLRSNPRPR